MEDTAKFCIEYLQKKGCEYAEVRIEEKDVNGFVLKNGIVELSGFDTIKGMGTRFLINKTLGFISLNDFNKNKIKENLDRALRITKKSAEFSDNTEFTDEASINTKYGVDQRIKFSNVSVEEKLKSLKEVHKTIESKNLMAVFLSLNDEVVKKIYVNSEGTKIHSEIPRLEFFYNLTLKENNLTSQRFSQFGATTGWESFKKWNLIQHITRERDALIKNLKEGVKLKNEKMDLVVSPEITGIMVHESCGHPCEADRILGRESAQAGESFITAKMIGDKVGSKEVNIVDDPLIEGGYGYFLYDDEGVKGRRNYLYKEGKIAGFLHNRETAKAMGIKSLGCARASDYDKETIVRMSNTFLLKGSYSENELIKDVKKGIFMKSYMEWNIDDKRWNQKYTGAESYLIENGKITKPIRNPSIEITTPKLWSSVDAVGKNFELHAGSCGKGEPLQGIPVTFGGPSMRLRNVWIR